MTIISSFEIYIENHYALLGITTYNICKSIEL